MYNYQMNKQLEMWENTNYSAQVEQLKKAGLNPALLYGKGGGMGATTGSASAGNMQSHAGSDTDRMGITLQRVTQGMNMALLASQKANIDADTKVKEAQAVKTSGVDTENVISQTNVNKANIKSIEANTRNTDLKSEGQLVTNELFKLQKLYEEGTLDDRILNQTLQNNQLDANIRKIEEEIPWIAKLANATIKDLEQKVRTGKADERLKFQEGSALVFENTKEQRDLRTAKLSAESDKILAEFGLTNQKLRDYVEKGIVPDGFDGRTMSIINRIIEHLRR